MKKEIIYNEEATELIKNTVIKLCDLVGLTLGPKGTNAIIDTDYSEPFITNDGVTIAKNIEFDLKEEVVAKIIKEASIKTCNKVGDGTTTSLVLLKSIYLESLKCIKEGLSPFIIKDLLEKKTDLICKEVLSKSKKSKYSDLEHIAAISSGNKDIGKIIRKAFESVGIYGKVIVEESNNENTFLDVINGMYLDSGVVSSFMINNRFKEEIIENAYILITDYKINSIEEIKNILYELKEKNLLIVADSFDEEVIVYLSSLKFNNEVNVVCIDSPNYSENKTDILEDICAFTKSNFISKKFSKNLEDINISDLGIAKKIKITRKNTIIYNETSEAVNNRIKYINKLFKAEDSEFEKEILESRLASLSKGIAVIYAGAKTNSEMILNKMRIEDAISASKMALKYGHSLGGGLTFYRISENLQMDSIENKILKKSLKAPIERILINSKINPNEVFKELNNKKDNVGFDASTGKYLDMEVLGIIDPTMVLIEALKNALSIASVLLTTSLIIVTNSKKELKNITEVL